MYDEFVKRLAAKVATLSMGNGAAAGVQLGPLINGGGLQKTERLVTDAVKKVCYVARDVFVLAVR